MRFVAGRGAVADRLVRGTGVAERLVRGTALAELLAREPPAQRTACWGAVAEQGHSCGRAPSGRCCLLWHRRCGASWQAGRGAVAEQGRCRAFAARNRRCCGARAPTIRRHRRGARALAQRKSAPAEQGRWQRARAGAGRQILSDSPSDLAITSAAQVLPYVFTAVRGISQSC